MSNKSRDKGRTRGERGRVFHLEALEDRRLLATSTGTFTGPSLTNLITQAFQGTDTSRATINTMLKALQAQLTSGPLADLNAGTVDGNGFVTEVQSLVGSYDQNVDQQLLPHFVNIDEMLKLQGQRIVADVVSLNQQDTIGVLSSSSLATAAQTAINSLTAGPIFSLDTPISAYVTVTQNFESDLKTLEQSLSSTSSTAPSVSDVGTTLLAEAEAYRADIHAGLQVTHPNISNMVDQAVNNLEDAESALDTTSNTNAQSQLTTAITAFDTAVLGTTGVFGPQGRVSRVNAELGYVPHNLTVKREATTLDSVSGTANFGGTATLTATLTSATGTAVTGATVSFTLDGAFAGTAVTDSSGVATLSGVPTSDAVGTATGAVVASFAGDIKDKASNNSGDLTVSQAGTTLGSVSNSPAISGQTSTTLSATLTSTVTGTGVGAGETVNFTVTHNGATVATAKGTTNSSGVATAPVPTTGLTKGDTIIASYAGSTNYSAAANATGTLA
jgi:hypothetical protein